MNVFNSKQYAAPDVAVFEIASLRKAICTTSNYNLPLVVEEEYDF